jgi:hypothetical protein
VVSFTVLSKKIKLPLHRFILFLKIVLQLFTSLLLKHKKQVEIFTLTVVFFQSSMNPYENKQTFTKPINLIKKTSEHRFTS